MGKLTKQQQQLIVGILLFVFGGGYVYWNMLLKPTLAQIREREQRHSELVSKIETAERQARRLPALQNELAMLQSNLSQIEKQLPKDRDIPNILRTLTKEANQENLQFTKLTPKPSVRQQYFDILPFDLQFNGSLQNFVRFLSSLGQQDRIFQAQNVTLSPGGGSSGETFNQNNLSIILTIQTYAYAG